MFAWAILWALSALPSALAQYCGYREFFNPFVVATPLFSSSPVDVGANTCIPCGANLVQTKNRCAARCAVGEVVVGQAFQIIGAAYCQNCPLGQVPANGPNYFFGKATTNPPPDVLNVCKSCESGKFATLGAAACEACPAGRYADSVGTSTCRLCPPGSAAGPGATVCKRCEGGAVSSIHGGSTIGSGGEECMLCAAGTVLAPSGGSQPVLVYTCSSCAAGSFSGTTGSLACQICGPGTFSTGDPTACTSCGDRADSHWLSNQFGAKSRVECLCEPAFTGEFCNLEECDQVLRGASLGGLLLEAAWPESTRDMANAEVAWNTIFRSADTNGDNYLSRAEALGAIASMHMAAPDAAIPIWSRQMAGSDIETFEESSVTISDMVRHTIAARTSVDLRQHGGGGQTGLISVKATYPAADWNVAKCRVNEDSGVNLVWSLSTRSKQLYRQCPYRNGVLHDAFVRTFASGGDCSVVMVNGVTSTECTISDDDGVGVDDRKRLYCVEALFCANGVANCDAEHVDATLSEVRCSTGLVYDGAPADVVPALISATGVRFAWLDTSEDEDGFRIFRSPVGAPEKTTLIADIPTSSVSCGQPFSPISYYDRDVGDVPGTHVMYTVSTVAGGIPVKSTTALFTSPWVGTLTVNVMTESGSPVRGVAVEVDHLLDDGSVDAKYAPLIAGETDIFGDFESEIRVTDRTWTAVKQHFLVRVSKTTELRKGAFEHVFAPAEEHVTVSHFQSTTMNFIDESAVAISGVVRYDLDSADFGEAGACDFETAAGCYCPVRSTVIVVDRGRGDVETYPTDERGAFAFAAAYMSNVTVRLEPFNGVAGIGRNHSFRLDAVLGDGESDAARAVPSTSFVATRDTVLDFVATDSVDVLGGGDGVAYVHGQPVVFALDGCGGFRRELYTYQGYVATALPPAPKFELRLGAADFPCASVPVDTIVNALTNTAIKGCRAEMPVFQDADNVTRPCATSSFKFVDEYFSAVSTKRTVDLSALAVEFNETAVPAVRDELYFFAAPLCVDKVQVEAQQLRDLNRWASDATTRTIAADEAMLLEPPQPEAQGPEPYGSTCFGEKSLGGVFVEGDSFSLRFRFKERHPKPDDLFWPWDYKLEGGASVITGLAMESLVGIGFHDRVVDSKPLAGAAISVVVNDGISGGESETATYDLAAADFGYTHRVAVGDPNPFTPFTKVVIFEFARAVDGGRIDFTRHAVVLGVIQDDVPSIFMMSTDPTLIFTVLRDPPGGDSFATITEGTEVSMGMAIAGMHAAGHEYVAKNGGTLGLSVRLGVSLGIAVASTKGILDLSGGVGLEHTLTGPAVGASRSQSQAHDLTFTFDVAISTSTDPFLAGQPSDVIVGGGANLRVLTAIKVDIKNEADEMYCVTGGRTYEWLPEQLSTFVVTVYEIEQTMVRLGALIRESPKPEGSDDAIRMANGGDEYARSMKALENWKTVLSNYRKATVQSETSIEAGVNAMLGHFKTQFEKFTADTENGDAAFSDYLAEGMADLSRSEHVTRFPAVVGQKHISESDVRSYADSVHTFLRASKANCEHARFSCQNKSPGIEASCQFGTNVDRLPALQRFCQSEYLGDAGGSRTAFDALGNPDRLRTFSGSTAVQLEISLGESTSRSSDVGFTTDASTSYSASQSLCSNLVRNRRLGVQNKSTSAISRRLISADRYEKNFDKGTTGQENAPSFCRRLAEAELSEFRRRLGVGINSDFSQTWGSSFNVELSRSSARDDAQTHAVSVHLADPSPYDFFAVKISMDPVYGTPIFTTMGGQSSCPGETGTTKIDARVTIAKLEYHCGDSFKPRTDCDDLQVGEMATIGVILQNLSPAQGGVLYRLDVQQASRWNAGKYSGGEAGYCGNPGDSSGLKILINGQKPASYMLDGLPYGQSEVFLTVERTHPSCYEFNDVKITLSSQCEYPADAVYQYRTTLSEVDRQVSVVHPIYEEASGGWGLDTNGKETAAFGENRRPDSSNRGRRRVDSSTASFSVAWQRARPMTTPEPTTRFPTRAPSMASLGVSVVRWSLLKTIYALLDS
ncbi:hypothetical protein M885DRAFT_499110 [Pelagophyceae sp. CCMP2097]|nr:hypothetical protein M885DRAFT_499110 [Pelagophyceae sp. CCMP2097]